MRRRWGLKREKVGSIRELIKLVRALTIDDVEIPKCKAHVGVCRLQSLCFCSSNPLFCNGLLDVVVIASCALLIVLD